MMTKVVQGISPNIQYELVWDPELVKGGDESYVFHRRYELELNKPAAINYIGSFLGCDTGDIVEMHLEVADEASGLRLYARSVHKEDSGIYDAWDWQSVDARAESNLLVVDVLCRVTGRNWRVFTKRLNPLTAYFHPAVVIGVSEL